MKIEKYRKLNNGKYKIFFEKDTDYILYEDVILKHNLLLTKEIDLSTLKEVLKDNEYYEAFNISLNYIIYKMRTKKEIKEYLIKKDIDNNTIIKIIDKLQKEGYLNDILFIKSYIHDKLLLTMDGPYKIKNNLKKLELNEDLIEEELNNVKTQWNNKLEKYIEKNKKLNKKYSNYYFNKKITNDLIQKGYSKEMFTNLLTVEEDNEEIKKQEYDKIYKKLSKKYSGTQLDYKVKNEMYKKGFII